MDVCWGGTDCTTEELGTGDAIALAEAESCTEEYLGVHAEGGGGALAFEDTAEARVDAGGGDG